MTDRRVLAGLLVPLLTLGLSGCTDARSLPVGAAAPSSARPSAARGAPSSDRPDARVSLQRTFAAGVSGDRTAWDMGTAASDPGFAARSDVLFANLRALRPVRLQVHPTGVEQPLRAARRATLGPGARVVQARLDWRLLGERSDASSLVWVTLVPGPDGERLAGTDDGTTLDAPALPLWWLGPVSVRTRGDVTVLVGAGQDVDRWSDLAREAAADTRAHLPRVLADRWDGRLVVEVPADETTFTRVLGAAPAAYATTAAVTRPEGPTTHAAVRVVVNPATARDPDAALGATLTHETVHVATRSAASAAPLWAVEGLAEHVALRAHPDQRTAELAALRGVGRPTVLPPDGAFAAGAADVTGTYAQAWLVCEAVADHRGEAALGRLYLALDRGRPLAAAADATLDVDDAVVVRWWRAALRQAQTDAGG